MFEESAHSRIVEFMNDTSRYNDAVNKYNKGTTTSSSRHSSNAS